MRESGSGLQRVSLSSLLIMAMSLIIGACVSSAGETSSSATDTMQPTSTKPPYPADEFTELMSAAIMELDQQWSDLFGQVSIEGAQVYVPPSAVVPYRAGDLPDTTCARSGGPERWRSNAVYCPDDQRIVYDEDWLRSMVDEFGEYAAVTVLAHEWGHHAQSIFGSSTLSLPNELQADCLAGMYISSSALLSHESLEAETPALMAALSTFFSLGNAEYTESEWFAASEHGSPQQRALAVTTGLLSNQETVAPTGSMATGLPYCYGYRDFVPSDTVDIGQYRLLKPPGLSVTSEGDTVAIEPEQRTGQRGSTVILAWVDQFPLGTTTAQIQQLWEILDAYRGAAPIGDPISLEGNASPGPGIAQYFEVVPSAEGQSLQSGFFALIAPSSGEGGLLIVVVRFEAAPTDPPDAADLAKIEEQVNTLFQVLNRLCAPDESGEVGAPNFDVVCMDTQ